MYFSSFFFSWHLFSSFTFRLVSISRRLFFLRSGSIGHRIKAIHIQEPHNFSATFIITIFLFFSVFSRLLHDVLAIRSFSFSCELFLFFCSCKTYKNNIKRFGADVAVMSWLISEVEKLFRKRSFRIEFLLRDKSNTTTVGNQATSHPQPPLDVLSSSYSDAQKKAKKSIWT